MYMMVFVECDSALVSNTSLLCTIIVSDLQICVRAEVGEALKICLLECYAVLIGNLLQT